MKKLTNYYLELHKELISRDCYLDVSPAKLPHWSMAFRLENEKKLVKDKFLDMYDSFIIEIHRNISKGTITKIDYDYYYYYSNKEKRDKKFEVDKEFEEFLSSNRESSIHYIENCLKNKTEKHYQHLKMLKEQRNESYKKEQ